jgi:hypothetical protein
MSLSVLYYFDSRAKRLFSFWLEIFFATAACLASEASHCFLNNFRARVVHTGENGVEMAAFVVWGGEGACLTSFWKYGTPSYSKCYHRGFGGDIW